jgi:hypothetical protein
VVSFTHWPLYPRVRILSIYWVPYLCTYDSNYKSEIRVIYSINYAYSPTLTEQFTFLVFFLFLSVPSKFSTRILTTLILSSCDTNVSSVINSRRKVRRNIHEHKTINVQADCLSITYLRVPFPFSALTSSVYRR